MSNCNCGYDIGDPRVACHAENCTKIQIKNLKAANHWRAIEEEKLRKRIMELEGTIGLERIAAHKLKEAAEQVVFECEADDDGMMPSVAAVRKLKALLGGGG